jgi:hopanoid C-2 methylase
LWDRLARDQRLVEDQARESNVRFLRPYDEVVAMWRRSIAYANDPERLFARFRHQVDATYVNRRRVPARGKLTWSNLSGAAALAFRIVLYVGILADYRRPFWRAFRHALRRGQVDGAFGLAFIAYHLIEFTREALRGEQNASFYSQARKDRDGAVAAAPIRKSA